MVVLLHRFLHELLLCIIEILGVDFRDISPRLIHHDEIVVDLSHWVCQEAC